MTNHEADEQSRILRWVFDAECEKHSEDLYRMAQAERRGLPIADTFASLLAHRDGCSHCTEVYDELLFMLEVEASEGLVAFDEVEDTELSSQGIGTEAFLSEQSGATASERAKQEIKWVVHQTQRGIQILLNIPDMIGAQPEWQTRSSTNGDGEETSEGEFLFNVSGNPNQPEVEIKLSFLSNTNSSKIIDLEVEISIPERWPDFSGIEVFLRGASDQATTYRNQQTTGPNGIVQFRDIKRDVLPAMQVSIEIPLSK
ncbi:MAG: hypothetical protein AAF702_20040 [Chloroflexota bacterium]